MRQIGLRKSVDYESMNGFHVSRIGLVLCAAVVLFAGVVLSWLKDCLRIKSGKDWRFLYKLVSWSWRLKQNLRDYIKVWQVKGPNKSINDTNSKLGYNNLVAAMGNIGTCCGFRDYKAGNVAKDSWDTLLSSSDWQISQAWTLFLILIYLWFLW